MWDGGGVDPNRVPLPGYLVGGCDSPGVSPEQPLATVQSIQTAPFQRLELHPTLPGQAYRESNVIYGHGAISFLKPFLQVLECISKPLANLSSQKFYFYVDFS